MNESEGIHDPDWGRFGIEHPNASKPVGDPTRWGAQVFTALTDALITAGVINTSQILQVQTRDGYSRSWALLGTLSLPGVQWNAVGSTLHVQLELTMGVGQVQITHVIELFNAFTTPYSGLCMSQHFSQGGPYSGTFETSTGIESRAFAIIGGLVGQSISVRGVYGGAAPVAGLPATSRLGLIVTPYAAGEGL